MFNDCEIDSNGLHPFYTFVRSWAMISKTFIYMLHVSILSNPFDIIGTIQGGKTEHVLKCVQDQGLGNYCCGLH